LGNIYQTFGSKELYPSLEEKAAQLEASKVFSKELMAKQ